MSKLRALICLIHILFFILIFVGFVTETEPIITEPGFFKPKPKPNPNRRLRFSILKTEDIWLRFRFYPETEPNRPTLSPNPKCNIEIKCVGTLHLLFIFQMTDDTKHL